MDRRYSYPLKDKKSYIMTEIRNEQRQFTRVALDLPVEVHQGGSSRIPRAAVRSKSRALLASAKW